MNFKEVKECFEGAKKEDIKGIKHRGLLITKPNQLLSEDYISKAKKNLWFCEVCKSYGMDYKLPEEWFYILYYCALAILSKFGIESRNQRCTAAFLRYTKDKGLIEYDSEFIERITVHKEKEKKSDVDKREFARYGSLIKIPEVEQDYDKMMELCKKAISQAEEIVFSNKNFTIPEEVIQAILNQQENLQNSSIEN